MVEHPLRVLAEQGEFEGPRERQREPPCARLQQFPVLTRLEPQHCALERRDRLAARRGEPRLGEAPHAGRRATNERREPGIQVRTQQRVERQHVGGALPDRQDVGVAQQRGESRVLDVACAAEALDDFAHDADGLLAGDELRERRDEPEERALLVVDLAALLPAVQLDQQEGEQERAPGLRFECRECVHVQRLPRERLSEGLAPRGVRARERESAAHRCDRAHAVPHAGHDEHRLDRPRAVERLRHQLRACTLEHQLGGRHLARPELVLQPVDAHPVEPPLGVAHLDVEHREALAARRVALGPGERQGHLRGDGGGEPLAAVEPPALPVLHCAGLGASDVGTARRLGHPLAAGPEGRSVARREPRHRALDELPVAGLEQ